MYNDGPYLAMYMFKFVISNAFSFLFSIIQSFSLSEKCAHEPDRIEIPQGIKSKTRGL